MALNSTSFNAARTIGPAIAGVLIGSVGTGIVFLVIAASFAAVLGSLALLRVGELHVATRARGGRGSLLEGFAYVRRRPDLQAVLLMIFLIGTFGFNFPIFISTMAVTTFHIGASRFGLLTSMMASGSVIGALLAAGRATPRLTVLLTGSALFGLGFVVAALMPNLWLFGVALLGIGIAAQTFTATGNGYVQMSTDPGMRGRVMAILLAVLFGGTPLGAPIVGWVADRFGPRWALGVGAVSGIAALAVGVCYLATRPRAR